MTLFSCFSRLLNRNVIRPNPLPGSTRVIFQILASRTYSSEDIQCRHEESRALENDEISRDPSLVNVADIPAPHTGHIRVITLNSPHNKNAISRPLLWDLGHQIRRTQDQISREADLFLQEKRPGAAMGQGTRAIVIGSEVDGVFCAGADLKERKTMTEDEYVYPLLKAFLLHDNITLADRPTEHATSSTDYAKFSTHYRN